MREEWHDAELLAKVLEAREDALDISSEFLLAESNKTIPIEEGTLERSGGTDVDGDRASVFYDTVYARRQHEELTWRHDPGRRAKWLELTLKEKVLTIRALMGERIRRAFS